MASASVMFSSNEANLAHSVTTIDQSSLPNLDTGIIETPDEALARRHPNPISLSIHEPNHTLHQVMDFQSGHGGMNGEPMEPLVPSNIDDNPRRVITQRVGELSYRAGHDDGRVVSPIDSRKRIASEGSLPSRAYKKRKIEPPSNVPPVHELSHPPPPTHPPKEFEPPRGGKKCQVEPLSTMRKEDYYYSQNTSLSLDDHAYFDEIITKLRTAIYLLNPQGHEPTISSQAGVTLVGEPRVDGPGRARELEPVYSILVDKPPSGPFVCWICGHLATWRSSVNTSALLGMFASTLSISPGSVPRITELSEVALVNLKGNESDEKMGLGEDHHLFLKFSLKAPPSGQRFSYQEALDDHQGKNNNSYPCRFHTWYERRQLPLPLISRPELIILFSNKTFSNPSNQSKHEKKHG